jgi:hypothetical protein
VFGFTLPARSSSNKSFVYKPSGSIRIRVETIDYFLCRYREDIIKRRTIEGDIEAQLAALEQTLRSELALAGD